ncbi:MAG TPA: glycosyltransferase family 4 protein [Thermoplasmata archaeon]|nr:glycosyltransferase family 4 protein [Thermoplasmata archaeon]
MTETLGIVLASHRFWPSTGGSERTVQNLARALAARGHRVTVVTSREPGSAAVERFDPGFTVLRLPTHDLGRFRWVREYLPTLRRLEGTGSVDVFHLNGNRVWCAEWYLAFQRRFRWPVVLNAHGFWQLGMRDWWFDRWYFRRYFAGRLARWPVYLCYTSQEAAQVRGWGYTGRTIVLPPVLDRSEFPPRTGPRDPRLALVTGGNYPNKRVAELLEAVAGSGWHFEVTGPRLPDPRLDSIARHEGDAVRILGIVPRATLLERYAAASAYLSMARWEGYGVALQEALAAGTPFVATPTGGAPDFAARGAGFLAEDRTGFLDGLGRLEAPSTWAACSRAGVEASREADPDAVLPRYEQAYREAIDRRLSSGPAA